MSDNSFKNGLLFQYHATFTDAATPPQGNNYILSGSWSIAHSFGNTMTGASGFGTVTGTCTSSFSSDRAACVDAWQGTISPP